MLALAILSIVLAVGYSFNYYIYKSFTIASDQSEVQFNVRMAKERIESIVRFTTYMEILEDYTDDPEEPYEAIYVENGSLMHYKDGTSTNLLEGSSSGISFEIDFNKADEVFLWYNVKGEISSGQTYEISAESGMLNEIIKDFGDSSTTGKAIIFGFEEE